MAGAINFGLIDPNTSLKAANSFTQGQEEAQRNALAKLQLESAQGQNELARYGLSKARREDEIQNALLSALQSGADPYTTYMKSGKAKEAVEIKKAEQESAKTKAETNVKNLELVKHFATAIGANPSPEYANKTLDYLEQLTGMKLDNDRAELAKLTDPEQIKRWAYSHAVSAENQMPKFDKVDNGQTIKYVDTNPLTNPNPQPVQKFATPGEQLSAARALEIARMVDARQRDANVIAQNSKVPENSTAIRKEFEGLPEVKNYKQALPAFKGIEDAVTRNTPQSDINLVYGIAKLYDPNSVVREGEYATVANSPAIPERIKGYAQYLSGGGKLTPEVKKQILTEARSRMQSFEDQYGQARTNYESIAKRSNADPSLLFPTAMQPVVKPEPVTAKPTTKPASIPEGWDVKVK